MAMRGHGRAARLALLWLALLALAGALCSGGARGARGGTTVTLEFDDGWANQSVAHSLLVANGLRGTFFVHSGLIGRPGRLTRAQLRAFQAAAEEVGGHTTDHPHLTALSDDAIRAEICLDRERLLAWGLSARSLAYPYGEYDARTQAYAAACGYDSARQVGGLVTATGGCAGCPRAEARPPTSAYRFRTRTPSGVTAGLTAADLERLIVAARDGGGGWVQIVFHQICAPGTSAADCGPYGFAQSELASLVAWLADPARAGDGIAVRRVNQVIAPSPIAHPPAALLGPAPAG